MSGPTVPKCPNDGAWLAVIPTARGTSHLCYRCGRAYTASMRDGSLVPDPQYAGVPRWLLDAAARIGASSTDAAATGEKLAQDLHDLARRTEGGLSRQVTNAADLAGSAARQARSAAEGLNVLFARLGELQRTLDEAGLDRIRASIDSVRTDLAEVRRQLHEHIDRHAPEEPRPR